MTRLDRAMTAAGWALLLTWAIYFAGSIALR